MYVVSADGDREGERVDGYVALVPEVLRSGETAPSPCPCSTGNNSSRVPVSVSLFDHSKIS